MTEMKCITSEYHPEVFSMEDGKEFTMIGSQDDLLSAMHHQIKRIRNIATRTKIMMSDQDCVYVYDDKWTNICGEGVQAIACSLNKISVETTVVNVKVMKGEIKPHKHDRLETIFVVEGEYIDPITNTIYRANDVQVIPPHTLHALQSTFCILTVTWKPAYHTEKIK